MQILHFTSLSKVPEARSYAISLETKLFYDRTLLLDKVVEYIRDFDASKQTKAYVPYQCISRCTLMSITADFWSNMST